MTLESIPVELQPVQYLLVHTSVTATENLFYSESQLVRCLLCLLDVIIITAACVNSSGVYLALRGLHIANNSNINIRNIGQSPDSPNGALQCITDRMPCCFSLGHRFGEWYLPSRTLVQGVMSTEVFYRNRGDNGEVSLNRPTDVMSPFGQFCCEIPDATNTVQTLCVNIGMLHS